MPPKSAKDFVGKVALLAEDEPLIRNYVQFMLVSWGFDVIIGTDGQEALERSRQHSGPIDLLLTNVNMPRMNGIELANILRQERPGISVIIMSGHSTGETNELLYRAEYLAKPFLGDVLKAKITAVLSGSLPEPGRLRPAA
jgi:DNA-binding response OmpR family regulator